MSSFTRWVPRGIVSEKIKNVFFSHLNIFSYLYPDGRSVNPDLSWAVQATPEDHVKVKHFHSITGSYFK